MNVGDRVHQHGFCSGWFTLFLADPLLLGRLFRRRSNHGPINHLLRGQVGPESCYCGRKYYVSIFITLALLNPLQSALVIIISGALLAGSTNIGELIFFRFVAGDG